jgi:hypothetical protein
MKPEKEQLLGDLWPEDSGREVTLRQGSVILRRRRLLRRMGQGLAVVSVVALALIGIQQGRRPETKGPEPAAAAPQPRQARILTDDQLLALFPDASVGLIKLHDGSERLVFLRPEDEERYVTSF